MNSSMTEIEGGGIIPSSSTFVSVPIKGSSSAYPVSTALIDRLRQHSKKQTLPMLSASANQEASPIIHDQSTSLIIHPDDRVAVPTTDSLDLIIHSLMETIESGEREKNQLLQSLRAFQSMSSVMSSRCSPPLHSDEDNEDTDDDEVVRHRERQMAAGRHDDQRRRLAATTGSLQVSRSVSPSHAAAGVAAGGREPFHRCATANPRFNALAADEGSFNRSYKELLMDNRALLLSVDGLKRQLRQQESGYELRLRRMQRLLTEASEQAQTLRDRCLLLEAEVSRASRDSAMPASAFHQGERRAFSRNVSYQRLL